MRNWLRKQVASAWLLIAPGLPFCNSLMRLASETGESKAGPAVGAGAAGLGGLAALRTCQSVTRVGEDVAAMTKLGKGASAAVRIGEDAALTGRVSKDAELVSGLSGDGSAATRLGSDAGPLAKTLDSEQAVVLPSRLLPGLEDGNVARSAVAQEPVILLDSSGRPIQSERLLTRSAEAQCRERASRILAEALRNIPPNEWKSDQKLQAAIAKALQKEPSGSYAFDVTSGKLTLKTTVKRVEISGEVNLYGAVAKAATTAGVGYGAARLRGAGSETPTPAKSGVSTEPPGKKQE
jgi:hypothetical protein